MQATRETLWKRLVPALAAAFLLAAPPALASAPPPPLTSATEENGVATLEWTSGYSPDSFQWRGKKNDGDWTGWGGGVAGSVINGTARSHTISNIKSGNTYTFQLRSLSVEVSKSVPLTVVTTYSGPSNSMSVTVPEE